MSLYLLCLFFVTDHYVRDRFADFSYRLVSQPNETNSQEDWETQKERLVLDEDHLRPDR